MFDQQKNKLEFRSKSTHSLEKRELLDILN